MAELNVKVEPHLAREVVYLISHNVEGQGISQINEKQQEIHKQLALIDLVNALKGELVRAAREHDAIHLNDDPALREAYKRFIEAFPDADGILPDDGIIHAEGVQDIQRLLDGRVRRPTTLIEYLMIEVGRIINDQQAINDAGREILRDFIESVKHWIRNSRAG